MNKSFRKKSIVVMIIMSVLLLAGHYYIYTVPIEILRELRIISSSALLGLCLFGSIFLLTDSFDIRLRRVFAMQMLMVAIGAGFTLVKIITQYDAITTAPLISPGILLYGNVYAFIMLIYPLELLCSGQMRLRFYVRYILVLSLMIVTYFTYTYLGGCEITTVLTMQDLLSNLNKVDVWVRLIVLAYPVWLLFVVMRQKKQYIDWCSTNFSNTDYLDLGWLNYYLFGYFIIMVSYMMVTLLNNSNSFIMHSFTFLIFFCFALYYILQQKVPTLLEDRDALNGTDLEPKYNANKDCCTAEHVADDKYRFVDKIPQYKADLERWMQEVQPYKNKDFKLLDVMQVLPLNRSYISHLFNEGYGETFFNFVMRYRIEESVGLLKNHPEMNIRHISDMCGFSSPSVFGRAFLKNKGVTPKQYRIDLESHSSTKR